MNKLKTSITRIGKARSTWQKPGSFGGYLLENIEHRIGIALDHWHNEQCWMLEEAIEELDYASVREAMLGNSTEARRLIDLRNEIITLWEAAEAQVILPDDLANDFTWDKLP